MIKRDLANNMLKKRNNYQRRSETTELVNQISDSDIYHYQIQSFIELTMLSLEDESVKSILQSINSMNMSSLYDLKFGLAARIRDDFGDLK